LPAHFLYYLVTMDAGGHWAAKKIQKGCQFRQLPIVA
jgi:hypothetical protein